MPLIRKKHLILAVAIAAMGFVLTDNRFQFFVLALQYEPTMADFSLRDTTVTNVVSKTDRSGREAALLSAFFGLDNRFTPFDVILEDLRTNGPQNQVPRGFSSRMII